MRTFLPLALTIVLLTACRHPAPAEPSQHMATRSQAAAATPTVAIPTTGANATSAVAQASVVIRMSVTSQRGTATRYRITPSTADCQDSASLDVVRDFVAAFNRGDQAALLDLFPAKGSDPRDPARAWTGDPNQLRWFSLEMANPSKDVGLFNAYTRETLLAYFAERHRQRERIRIIDLKVNPASGFPGTAAINFRITRQADDLPERTFSGKGGVNCAQRTIFLWSQGSPE